MIEIWTARPPQGFVKLVYEPGHDPYPFSEVVTFQMPVGFDPTTSAHDPNGSGFPSVSPLLQGFDTVFGEPGSPQEHAVRQLRIDLQTDGWNVVEGGKGIVSQGPRVRVLAGIRDNSGGDPPDDAFVVWVNCSALVVYQSATLSADSGRR